jgi:protein TonB
MGGMIRVADLRRRAIRIGSPSPSPARSSDATDLPSLFSRRVGGSILLHLAAAFLFWNAWWCSAPRLTPAGTSKGRNVVVTYNPGRLAPAPPLPVRRAISPKRLSLVKPISPAVPDAKTEATVQGNDALGNGTVSLLYVQAFPEQKPDLSTVGTTGDVVVDVEIDDTGHVAQVHARHGMGSGIDDQVVATVEHWIFHPAVRDGRAISSERELHFHFDRRRDPNCGWECFALQE